MRTLLSSVIIGLAVVAIAGCGVGTTSPSAEPPVRPSTAAPLAPSPSPVPLGLSWETVTPSPDLVAKRGFEHTMPVSQRGAMILERYLEGLPETLRATTVDGTAWSVETVPSGGVPFGYSVDGGADWVQLVPLADGSGLQAMASADGVAWEARGALPRRLNSAGDSAVNEASLLVCGHDRDGRAACALSPDGGRGWESVSIVPDELSTYGQDIRGIAPLADGFIAIVEGEQPGRHVVTTSPDGVVWTRQPDISGIGGFAVAPLGRRVVVAGMKGDPPVPYVAVTGDGSTWEEGTLPVGSIGLNELVPVGDAVVGIARTVEPEGADHVSQILVSRDGLTWQETEVPKSLTTWQSPTILPVQGGLVAFLGPAGETMVGRLTTK